MIWALLAMLGVPIWLIVGALTGALVSRRRFRSQPEVFAVLTREHGDDAWPRRTAYGRYVHGVLLVNSGLALVRTRVWAVDRLEACPSDAPPGKLADPQCWTATLDDGRQYDVAVAAVDAHRLECPPGVTGVLRPFPSRPSEFRPPPRNRIPPRRASAREA